MRHAHFQLYGISQEIMQPIKKPLYFQTFIIEEKVYLFLWLDAYLLTYGHVIYVSCLICQMQKDHSLGISPHTIIHGQWVKGVNYYIPERSEQYPWQKGLFTRPKTVSYYIPEHTLTELTAGLTIWQWLNFTKII
jgi:hypothetical protein